MKNDFYLQVLITREEWDAYSVEEKKRLLGKLSLIDVWIAAFLVECLQTYEKQVLAENSIDLEKTYNFYYGGNE